jgi:hypothetical protein
MTDDVARLRTVSLLRELEADPATVVAFEFGSCTRWVRSVAEGWHVVHETADGEVHEVATYEAVDGVDALRRACDDWHIRSLWEWPDDPLPEPFDPRSRVVATE